MNTTINIPIDIFQVFNTLIQNKGINIKKLYAINKNIIEDDQITIKNIYCKNRTIKENLCLNKCINDSKYCTIHDPIMRENRIINRRELKKIKREAFEKGLLEMEEEIKVLLDIDYKIIYEEVKKESLVIPSAPLMEDIIEDIIENPPAYMQKPDEVGHAIKNHINYNNIDIIFNNTESIIQKIESITIHPINSFSKLNMLKPDELTIESMLHTYNSRLLQIKGFRDNNENIHKLLEKLVPVNINKETNTEEVITNVENYKNQLLSIDYKLYEPYKGVKLRQLCNSIIEYEFKLYNSNKPTINLNSNILKFISKIIKNIPK